MKNTILKICSLFILTLGYSATAQTFISAYQSRANQVNQTTVNTNLQEFENLGVKKTGTVANNNALNWIKNKYSSYGYSASQIAEDSFSFGGSSGAVTSKNLVITKTGTLYPNIFVIVCGHFDSIVGPGVNDNGSGTTAILEAARILKDVPTEYSIKFIHFSGEEQGLYGSYHYVDNVVNATVPKMNIRLVFNMDQVGGKASNNNTTIYCDVDQSNPTSNNAASQSVTSQLATCTTLYSPLQTAYDPAYSSDYVPFQLNGEIITGFYEYTRSYVEHTVNDTYVNVDKTYVKNVAMAAVGAIQHFAIAMTTLGTSETDTVADELSVYPVPSNLVLNIDFVNLKNKKFTFEATDMAGNIVLKSENQKQIDISKLNDGVYIATIRTGTATYMKKFVVKN